MTERLRARMRTQDYHQLRHTFATHLARSCPDIPVVAMVLGHESWSTTKRYVEPSMQRAQEAVRHIYEAS